MSEETKITHADQFPPKGWKVSRTILHASFPVPLAGETESMYEKTSIGVGKSAVSGVTMMYTPEGLFCEYKGLAFIIPLANVKGCWI
jgi:hypothetical protein